MGIFLLLLLVHTGIAILLICSNISNVSKVILIPSLIVCSMLSFMMLQEYLGKPVMVTSLPASVIVYGQVVDKENDLIYLLYTKEGELPPARYVEMSYSEDLAEALGEGRDIHEGKPFKLTTEAGEGEGKEGEGEEGEGVESDEESADNGKSISLESATFTIHDLPALKMPTKDE